MTCIYNISLWINTECVVHVNKNNVSHTRNLLEELTVYSAWKTATLYENNRSVFVFFYLASGLARRETFCLCGRGEYQPVCLPSRVCAGVYRDALTAMETSARPDCLGHTPHLGIHLHLQRPNHLALGPGNLTRVDIKDMFFIAWFSQATHTCASAYRRLGFVRESFTTGTVYICEEVGVEVVIMLILKNRF